jgi:hypothetical protein
MNVPLRDIASSDNVQLVPTAVEKEKEGRPAPFRLQPPCHLAR